MLFKKLLLIALVFTWTITSSAQNKTIINSPDQNIQLGFWLNDQGTPMYEFTYKLKPVLFPSAMGFELKQTMQNEALPSLQKSLVVLSTLKTSSDTKWKPVWGDVKEIRDNFNQLQVKLSQKGDKAIQYNIIFRVLMMA